MRRFAKSGTEETMEVEFRKTGLSRGLFQQHT